MFNILKKKEIQGEEIKLKISGMHCTSCAMNIDGELEELDGVISSDTSYANAMTKVQFDPKKVNKEKFREVIKKLGYAIEQK